MTSDELLPPEAVAAIASNSTITLARWRRDGTGPRFMKIGRRIFYRRSDVEAWLAAQVVGSNAELQMRASERGAA
ncbi:MAG: helix-turn-helix transcriptional regulator [Hyphomicrobiaceae bacterium]